MCAHVHLLVDVFVYLPSYALWEGSNLILSHLSISIIQFVLKSIGHFGFHCSFELGSVLAAGRHVFNDVIGQEATGLGGLE